MKRLSPVVTVLVLILAVLTFANCKTTAPEQTQSTEAKTTVATDGSPMNEQAAAKLANMTWQIQSIGDTRVVASESPAHLRFSDDGTLAGSASCNRMMGSYKLDDAAGKIEIALGGVTEMMCSEELMVQEKAVLEVLPKITSFTVDGNTLTLTTDDGNSIVATTMSADTGDSQLVGEAWIIEDINGQGVIDDSQASITFSADGSLSGNGSCNRLMGSFSETEGEPLITVAGTTRMMCPEALMTQESNLLEILGKITGYNIDDNATLTLSTDDGRTITARRQ